MQSNWLTWLIALIRGWLGIKADIHDKEQQDVGATKEQNNALEASIKDYKHEQEIKNRPVGNDDSVVDKL